MANNIYDNQNLEAIEINDHLNIIQNKELMTNYARKICAAYIQSHQTDFQALRNPPLNLILAGRLLPINHQKNHPRIHRHNHQNPSLLQEA